MPSSSQTDCFCMDGISRPCSETSDAAKLALGFRLKWLDSCTAKLARVSRQQIWIAVGGVQNAVARDCFCMDAISRQCSEMSGASKLARGLGLSGFPVVAELSRVS